MKKCIFILLAICVIQVYGQQPAPAKNPQVQLTPQQKAMLKQMGINTSDPEKALKQIEQMKQKGQQPDFKAQGQNMINNMMINSGAKTKSAGDLGYFTNNASLVPEKDMKRINSVSKKIFSDDEMLSNTKLLYGKMMAKLPTAEKSIITSIIAKQTAAEELNKSSVTAMMQGHRLAALGLAMQAVIAKPVNLNYQNNMAALLTENGYPENAIPYLNTLQQLVPGNSTVKNNLGYAWLNLGEIDSAQRILTAAAALNPENTDTKTGEGVIQEKKGNTEEAGKNYEEAFVKAPSTLILDLLNNAGKGNPYDDKTADEIKSKLTVYEYFKKDWVSYPDLSNSVSGYEKDTSIQEGYGRMFVSYTAKLQKIYDTIKNSKYGDIFIPTAKGEMYGKLAQIIVTELKKIQQLYITRPGLSENLEAAKESLKKAISDLADIKDFNVRCKKEDQLRSNYLVEVNTLIKKYFLVLNEKNRFWINAFITYNLLTNHQYKEHLMEVVFYVESYVGSVAIGIYDLETDPGCENLAPLKPSKANINEPPLPKLLCPVNINANTVSNNYNDISKSATGTAPNATVAIGSAEGEIAEPGRAGTPSVCTSQGDVCSNGINEQDEYGEANQCIEETKTAPPTEPIKGEDGLKPLAEQLMAQEAETKAKPSTGKRQAYDDYVSDALLNILKKHNLRKWLQNQLSTDCDDLKPMEQDAPPPPIDIKNELDNVANGLQEMANQLTQQNNPADAQKLESVKTLLDEIQNAQQCIDKKSKTDPGWAKKYNQLTVSPTINNSLQAPNSNPTFIKGMFN